LLSGAIGTAFGYVVRHWDEIKRGMPRGQAERDDRRLIKITDILIKEKLDLLLSNQSEKFTPLPK
jgi:hypothetical protein